MDVLCSDHCDDMSVLFCVCARFCRWIASLPPELILLTLQTPDSEQVSAALFNRRIQWFVELLGLCVCVRVTLTFLICMRHILYVDVICCNSIPGSVKSLAIYGLTIVQDAIVRRQWQPRLPCRNARYAGPRPPMQMQQHGRVPIPWGSNPPPVQSRVESLAMTVAMSTIMRAHIDGIRRGDSHTVSQSV